MPRYLLIILLMLPFCMRGQVITTVAGTGNTGNSGDGGPAISADINYPIGGVFDKNGNLFFALGTVGNKIRKITPGGIISSVAGIGLAGYSGDGNLAINAELKNPQDLSIDTLGNLFIADAGNHCIRKVDIVTGIITTIAGNGISGFGGDGGISTASQMSSPFAICFDKLGNIYIATGNRIRMINTAGIISTIAGDGIPGHSGDGGLAIDAQVSVSGLCTDDSNNLYLAESVVLRKINLSTGIITKVAGGGSSLGDGGLAINAQVNPTKVATDKVGNLYIAEGGGNRIRKINSQGVINTVAGTGDEGYSGDGNLATEAELDSPFGIAIDTCGNIYIADGHNRRIRKVDFNPNCWPVSVNEHKEISFNLYPNPANESITITGGHLQSISITNTLGQVVHWQKVSQEKTVVDVSALGAGVYFVTVVDVQGEKVVRKVVKE